MFRGKLGWISAALVLAVALPLAAYLRDIKRAYERVRGKSTVIPSAYGNVEHTEGGAGPHVLVIHGSGGGYDQGELIVQSFLDKGFHWIAPSRFGYLRSTCREGATFDHQAHAYAALLDHLGVESASVVALSHGGPSALLFAALYPERVSSL
jgi:2-hydroxy-6-oxonona-2,4-dienedioate hydrolase